MVVGRGTWHCKSFFEYFPGGEVTTFCTKNALNYATKPYSDGTCTVGFTKVHDRQDPQCRLHGVTSKDNVPIARAKKQPGEVTSRSRIQLPGETATSSRADSIRPLSEMTGFKTRRGLMLLYDPKPDDAWINRPIARIRGGWKDTSTGEVLSKTQAQAYSKFLRRHLGRDKVGDIADKLVRMVDKYLPLQADETRAYVCRFPEQAESLLKRVKKIRKRLRANKGERCTTTTRSSTTATAKGSKAKKRRGEECSPVVKSEEKTEDSNEPAVSAMGEHAKKLDGSHVAAKHVRKDRASDDSPDWGEAPTTAKKLATNSGRGDLLEGLPMGEAAQASSRSAQASRRGNHLSDKGPAMYMAAGDASSS
ncbi:hypothetical protein AK812_SmicGene36058 [Symbiodinium microadriaticum]|uniref:Uncharacterized protein n=1 Tax=Symbiodinium microadriaticum TaxID=2951 RepID=A0A1Q9CJW2_SYMMI|nr:hypothetical protein AK812_SmicGene36058 [Symbiodinium microadriaticum]